MSRPKCSPPLPQILMKKVEDDKFEKTGENKRVETLEEKEELILKEKSKEEHTLIKPIPVNKCPLPSHKN